MEKKNYLFIHHMLLYMLYIENPKKSMERGSDRKSPLLGCEWPFVLVFYRMGILIHFLFSLFVREMYLEI